ncbi:hypothetical protein JAAARDRAFT_70818 [Jaapia argillacea MUCL 33604]|uniref:Endoplasmic reticulum transmembrane protein n=1 Tax=Jaapia argillacea MUCL 33604 TaxID=933084 RepID=A0A067PMF0_9AGAM|nr:hypothetical protein JAAARDRAFT_70818 [Jaapia argillacea MUCL 33604]
MTIYYSLTFMLLASEMVTFCILVAPMPYAAKKRLFRFLSENPIVAKIAYGLKISFIFVGILFLDALQRMFRVTAESDLAKHGGQAQDVRTETNFAARKFYSQRNVYLTGFTLFLSLVLTRTFYIILDLIHTQEEYAKIKQETSKASHQSASGNQTVELEKKLATLQQSKDRDIETLKKQAAQQAKEYDELAERYNRATGERSNKKSD